MTGSQGGSCGALTAFGAGYWPTTLLSDFGVAQGAFTTPSLPACSPWVVVTFSSSLPHLLTGISTLDILAHIIPFLHGAPRLAHYYLSSFSSQGLCPCSIFWLKCSSSSPAPSHHLGLCSNAISPDRPALTILPKEVPASLVAPDFVT